MILAVDEETAGTVLAAEAGGTLQVGGLAA